MAKKKSTEGTNKRSINNTYKTKDRIQVAYMNFTGFAGGGHYNEQGNAAEYVCLPPDPNFVKTKGPDHGRMYGAEYDSNNFFASHSHDEDVPCVL
jgi:hypothetical protein